MVAGKQYADGCGERQPAVRAVGGEAFVTHVRPYAPRQILRVRKRVQTYSLVAYTQRLGAQLDVLQRGRVGKRKGKILFQKSRPLRRTRYLIARQAGDGDEARIVQDTLELIHGLHEFHCRFFVHLFGYDVAPTEGREVRLHPHPLFGRLRQKQVARVVEVGTFGEMPLVAAREEAHLRVARLRAVSLADEPVLLVDDAVFGQDLDGLAPRGVDRFVLGGGYGEQLRELDTIGDRDVRVLADDAAVLHRQKRELALERGGFQYVSHACASFLFAGNSRRGALRLIR